MSDEPKIQLDEAVVENLIETVEKLSSIVIKLGNTHEEQVGREEMVAVRDSLRRIAKVLLEGNGNKPLISRVAVLESSVLNLEKAEDNRKKQDRIDTKGKYAIGVAVVSGLAGVVTSLISLLS